MNISRSAFPISFVGLSLTQFLTFVYQFYLKILYIFICFFVFPFYLFFVFFLFICFFVFSFLFVFCFFLFICFPFYFIKVSILKSSLIFVFKYCIDKRDIAVQHYAFLNSLNNRYIVRVHILKKSYF